jgi:hypothetical protein
MNENNNDKSGDKKLITEDQIHSINEVDNKQEDQQNNNSQNIEENENYNENENENPIEEESKHHEDKLSLKKTRTKDLNLEKKEPIESLRFKMLILETIIIGGIIGIAVLEISGGLKIYTQYNL